MLKYFAALFDYLVFFDNLQFGRVILFDKNLIKNFQ